MNEGLKVLKRDNKKSDFNGEKIAVAIKKAFDSREEFIEKYTEEDVNKVYTSVLSDIYDNYFEKPYIKVEEIQDLIEKVLIKLEYTDVYESFSSYRDKRAESRKMFLSEPKQHKLLKAIEKITLKQDSTKKISKSPTDIMLNYGKTISEEFSYAYLINNKYTSLNESGQIYISDVEYYPMGTTESCVIDINKLLEKGFYVDGKYHKNPPDIMSCLNYISLILNRNSEDQHGEQGISNFDSLLVQSVINTFKDEFKYKISDFLDLNGYLNFVDLDSINKEIIKIESLSTELNGIKKHSKGVKQVEDIIDFAYKKAIDSTDIIVSKSINCFLHNAYYKTENKDRNIMISLGMDTSIEGRIVTKNYLLSLDDSVTINTNYILKEKINYNDKDINYDLFELACSSVLNGYNINFTLLDFPSNKSEVYYFEDGTRISENINADKSSILGRGVLSRTYINLARIGIKANKSEENKELFFIELEHILEIVKDQLLERFNLQGEKKASDFQFLIGENVYMDSKGLKQTEKIKKSIKNGLLGIGIVGLEECINSLKFEISDEEILNFINKKINKYKKEHNLNFVMMGPNKEVSTNFIEIDRAIYGDISKVTDKDNYEIDFNEKKNSYYQTIFDGGYQIIKTFDFKSIKEIVKYIKNQDVGYIRVEKKKLS